MAQLFSSYEEETMSGGVVGAVLDLVRAVVQALIG
jgi:hypothetical protein